MASRVELHKKLVELLGNNNVYYQPPENLKMEYPCIRYSKNKIRSNHADNSKYSNFNSYQIIVIDRRPDNPVIQKILELQYAEYDRNYVSNDLNHDVIILYF